MDIMTFIVAIATPLLAFLGVILGKRMELNKAHDQAVSECQKKHKGDIEEVKQEFNDKLDSMNSKLDEIKTEQLKTALYVTRLQTDLRELKDSVDNMVDKENHMEQMVAVLDNREKVSEHRLDDLEQENAKRKEN